MPSKTLKPVTVPPVATPEPSTVNPVKTIFWPSGATRRSLSVVAVPNSPA